MHTPHMPMLNCGIRGNCTSNTPPPARRLYAQIDVSAPRSAPENSTAPTPNAPTAPLFDIEGWDAQMDRRNSPVRDRQHREWPPHCGGVAGGATVEDPILDDEGLYLDPEVIKMFKGSILSPHPSPPPSSSRSAPAPAGGGSVADVPCFSLGLSGHPPSGRVASVLAPSPPGTALCSGSPSNCDSASPVLTTLLPRLRLGDDEAAAPPAPHPPAAPRTPNDAVVGPLHRRRAAIVGRGDVGSRVSVSFVAHDFDSAEYKKSLSHASTLTHAEQRARCPPVSRGPRRTAGA